MRNFYWADIHFNHQRIPLFCPNTRPFTSMKQMNETLIQKWNSRITNEDNIRFLGDFAFGDKELFSGFFNRLNGKKHLIIGNHDPQTTLSLGWLSINHYTEIQDSGCHVILSHYPLADWNRKNRGSIHLYGHVHGKPVQTDEANMNSYDVGVDNNNPEPLLLREIIDILEKANRYNGPKILNKKR